MSANDKIAQRIGRDNLSNMVARRAVNGKRPPLISFRELAALFEVSEHKLRGVMSKNSPPVSSLYFPGANRYYCKKEMVDWWSSLKSTGIIE